MPTPLSPDQQPKPSNRAESMGYGDQPMFERFAQTQSFKDKYGDPFAKQGNSYYYDFLRKAQWNPDGTRLFIPKGALNNNPGNLYFGSRGPNGEDYLSGDMFSGLQKDYRGWLDSQRSSDTDYAAYKALMNSNPGRGGTIFAKPDPTQVTNTVLGSARQTVFG